MLRQKNKVKKGAWSNQPLLDEIQIKNNSGEVIAGAAARSFGDWLLLDKLWVSEKLRGQDIGSKILAKIEELKRIKLINQNQTLTSLNKEIVNIRKDLSTWKGIEEVYKKAVKLDEIIDPIF